MDGATEGVHERLARESWKWADDDRSSARRECEPFVRAILSEAGFGIADHAVEYWTACFCALVAERKRALADRRAERIRHAVMFAAIRYRL